RADESRLDSVTGGNGSIYAVRRGDYVEVDSRFGHDLSFPYLMVQRGRRAVYEPEAHAYEKATPTTEDEYRRKVRMFEHSWAIVVEGKMLRRLRPLYLVEVLSHRHLRYASGVLHLIALGANIALIGQGNIRTQEQQVEHTAAPGYEYCADRSRHDLRRRARSPARAAAC